MREIKFRAWDKGLKRMIYLSEPTIENDDFSGIVFKLRDYFVSAFSSDRIEDLQLMQYTGLKDKNGREIYEGDICKVGETADGKDILALIYWDEKTACFRYRFNMVVMLTREDINPKNWEVIGNIYENPELLEEAEE